MADSEQLAWTRDYLLGDPIIDRQHQRMFELTNLVLATSESKELGLAVMALYRHLREHFSDEEDLMQRRNYEGYELHRQQHDDLITELNHIVEARECDSHEECQRKLKEFMVRWIQGHILEEDMKIPLLAQPKKP